MKPAIYRSPGGAPVIDVNDIRSELGNTRLSKDDGSIHKANSLKSLFSKGRKTGYLDTGYSRKGLERV